jgi:hypothetical protein
VSKNLFRLLSTALLLGLVSTASWQTTGILASAAEGKPTSLDTDPHLVGWWKLEDATGATAADSSTHGRNGTLKDGLSFEKNSVSGRIGKALKFDGKAGLVEITGYKGITGTRPRTVAAWIKTKTPKGEVLSWGLDDFGKMWIFGFIRSRLGVTPDGGYLYMNSAIHDDAWHHVAVVVQEADLPNLHDDVKLYLDGGPAKIHDIGLLDLWPIDTGSKLDLRIGRGFRGVLDDVRVYARALSEEEVKTLFAQSKPK